MDSCEIQRVKFPQRVPDSVEVSWRAIQDTLYALAVQFGVLELPKVTLYGVWKGKEGQSWQDETVEIECRSPKVEPLISRDMEILGATE